MKGVKVVMFTRLEVVLVVIMFAELLFVFAFNIAYSIKKDEFYLWITISGLILTILTSVIATIVFYGRNRN